MSVGVEESQVETSASADEAPKRSRLGVLRHRHFRNVWLGALTSSVGTWMEQTGIQWVMTTLTMAAVWKVDHPKATAPVMMGYLAVAQMIPMMLLGLWGGLLADRVNRKKLLIVTQAILMLIAAFLTFSAFMGWLTPWFLMAIGAANGITMAFNIPAWQVLTPRLVPKEELTAAITLNGIQFNMARVIGPALGGVLMSLFGAKALFLLNTMSFLAVLYAISGTPNAPALHPGGSSMWERTREAASFVFHNRGPFRTFFAMVLFSALAAPLMRMLPVFVASVYHAEASSLARTAAWATSHLNQWFGLAIELDAQELVFGVMLSMMGLGAVTGGISLKWFPSWYPKHHFIPLSVFLGGLSITVWSLITGVTGAAVAIFFCGAFWLWSFNSSMSAMQLLVDDKMRGRVLAVCNVAVFGAMPAGSVVAAYIGEAVARRVAPRFAETSGDISAVVAKLGPQLGVGILGALLTLGGVVMLIWRTPEVDGLKPGDPGYESRPGLWRGITASTHRPAREPVVDVDDPAGQLM